MRDFLAIQGIPKSDLTIGRYGELIRSYTIRNAEGDVIYVKQNKKLINILY